HGELGGALARTIPTCWPTRRHHQSWCDQGRCPGDVQDRCGSRPCTENARREARPVMTLFYLVRHGETDWNLERRVQGSSDIPLNETGRRQAARTARLLARRSWDAIYSSPLSRAMET